MKPWTEAHRREAQRRTYEIAAQMVSDGYGPSADRLALDLRADIGREKDWTSRLLRWTGLGAARIKREVRRVRALAEGRLVRETVWRVVDVNGDTIREEHDRHMVADLLDEEESTRMIHVTRIRRA